MINLEFYTFKERQPYHEEKIIFLNKIYLYDSETCGITSETVYYYWIDDDGNTACYNGEAEVEGYYLCIGVNGFDMTDSEEWLWCNVATEYQQVIIKSTSVLRARITRA